MNESDLFSASLVKTSNPPGIIASIKPVLNSVLSIAKPSSASATNGMVERFNGRISEPLKQTRFNTAAELEKTLLNYLEICNHHILQLLRANKMSGFVAHKMSGFRVPEEGRNETGRMVTGDSENEIRGYLHHPLAEAIDPVLMINCWVPLPVILPLAS